MKRPTLPINDLRQAFWDDRPKTLLSLGHPSPAADPDLLAVVRSPLSRGFARSIRPNPTPKNYFSAYAQLSATTLVGLSRLRTLFKPHALHQLRRGKIRLARGGDSPEPRYSKSLLALPAQPPIKCLPLENRVSASGSKAAHSIKTVCVE